MAEHCEGQFLWLKMQESSLKDYMSPKSLKRAISSTPKQLVQIYQQDWERIERGEASHRAISLLRWVAFAQRPLTIAEIAVAVLLNSGVDDMEELEDELPTDITRDYVDYEIIQCCTPFIETRKARETMRDSALTVHLAHFTIREFLVNSLH